MADKVNIIAVVNGLNHKSKKVMLKIKGAEIPADAVIDEVIRREHLRRIADDNPDSAASIKKALKGFVPIHKNATRTLYRRKAK